MQGVTGACPGDAVIHRGNQTMALTQRNPVSLAAGLGLVCILFGLCPMVQAATVTLTNNAGGAVGWMDPAKWDNGEAPSSAHNYVCHNLEIRDPDPANGSGTFPGNSLAITGWGRLKMHRQNVTITNFSIAAGCTIATVGNRQLSGDMAVTGSGTLTIDVETARKMTIAAEVTAAASVSGVRIHASQSHPLSPATAGGLTLTATNNIFTGTWDIEEGYLKGIGFGQSSFLVGKYGYLDFDYDYSNPTCTFEVEINATNASMGGMVLLDQDVTVGTATIWGEELDAGVYTGAELKNHVVYSNAFDAASGDANTLTVSLDPLAMFAYVDTVQLGNNGATNFDISVYPGKASYDSTDMELGSGTIGDGTVVDYAFYNSIGVTGSAPYTLNTYASGAAGLISDAVATYISGSPLGHAEVWTTTDPDVGAPDYGSEFYTSVRASHLTNTVDITEYGSGTVYVLYGGSAGATVTNTLTMSGATLPDLTVYEVRAGIGNDNYFMSSFDFANAAAYDTITAVHENNDLDDSPASKARYIGLIFDGEVSSPPVPDPDPFLFIVR